MHRQKVEAYGHTRREVWQPIRQSVAFSAGGPFIQAASAHYAVWVTAVERAIQDHLSGSEALPTRGRADGPNLRLKE
eukprot:8138731-Pyramimonas_sp.AAC.1